MKPTTKSEFVALCVFAILVEYFMFSRVADLMSQKSDVKLYSGVVIIILTAVTNYLLVITGIKIYKQNNQNKEK